MDRTKKFGKKLLFNITINKLTRFKLFRFPKDPKTPTVKHCNPKIIFQTPIKNTRTGQAKNSVIYNMWHELQ